MHQLSMAVQLDIELFRLIVVSNHILLFQFKDVLSNICYWSIAIEHQDMVG